MKLVRTKLPGCVVIEPAVFGDERGFFYEGWNAARFAEHGLPTQFVQHNVSRSQKGVLRGLHYQMVKPQGKLVRVTQGAVFDVAVDVRRGSTTFGRWVGVELTADNQRQLWLPAGMAHGFVVLSESADFLYKATDYYAPEHERCIAWNDTDIGIDWPLAAHGIIEPLLSAKDRAGVPLARAEIPG